MRHGGTSVQSVGNLELEKMIFVNEACNEPVAQVKEQLRGPASLLLEEVSSVRGELVKAEDALRTANERFLRLNADFDNYRKRTVRCHALATWRAASGLAV